jgi:hypothetical protein
MWKPSSSFIRLNHSTSSSLSEQRLPWRATSVSAARCIDRSRDVLITIKSNGRRVSVHWFAGVLQSLCSPANPFSAMRAPLLWWLGDKFEDGLTDSSRAVARRTRRLVRRRVWPHPARAALHPRPADVKRPDYPSETFRVLKKNEITRFGEYVAVATEQVLRHRHRRLVLGGRDDDDGRSRIASTFAISRCRWVGCSTIYAVSVIENQGLILGWRF